jgi:WD40 repeat protein
LHPIINKGISMSKKVIVSIFILIFLLAGCASGSQDEQVPPTASGTEDVLTSTPQPSPTLPPPTPTGTATALPTAVPTATITPVPWPSNPISLDNVGEMQEVSRWGRGSIWRTYYTKTDEALVLTSLGLYIYQVEPLMLLAQIDLVDDFVVSADEKWLAVSKTDNRVEIWDLDAKALSQHIEHAAPQSILDRMEKRKLEEKYVVGMAFAPDSTEIAIGYMEGVVNLWKLGQDAPYASLKNEYFALGPEDYTAELLMKYGPDGKSLVIARTPIFTTYTRLTFWTIPDGTLISVSEPARFIRIPDLNFAPETGQILALEDDQSFKILSFWDTRTGKRIARINTALAVIDTDSMELVSNGEQIRLQGRDSLDNPYQQSWSISDGKPLENTKLTELPQNERQIKFQGALLEMGHYQTLWPEGQGWTRSQVKFLDNQTFRLTLQKHWLTLPAFAVEPFNLPEEDIRPSYYDFENESLAWCKDNTLYWKDSADNIKVIELPNLTSCVDITISSKKTFAAGWNDRTVLVVKLETGETTQYQQKFPHRLFVHSVAFSEDEKYLLVAEQNAQTILKLEPEVAQINRLVAVDGKNSYIAFLENNEDFIALNGNDVFSTRETSDIYTTNRIVVWNAPRLGVHAKGVRERSLR